MRKAVFERIWDDTEMRAMSRFVKLTHLPDYAVEVTPGVYNHLVDVINALMKTIEQQQQVNEMLIAQVSELNAAVFSTRAVKPKDKRQVQPL